MHLRTKKHSPGLTQTPFTDEKCKYREMEVTSSYHSVKWQSCDLDPVLIPSLIFFECHSCQFHVCSENSFLTDRVALVKESKAIPKNQNPRVFLGHFMEEWKPWLGEQENTLETS